MSDIWLKQIGDGLMPKNGIIVCYDKFIKYCHNEQLKRSPNKNV